MLRARPSCAICATLVASGLGQDGVGARPRRSSSPCRPGARARGSSPRRERAHRADEPLPSPLRAPATTRARARVDDVADRVDGDERGDRQPADPNRRGADAALHRARRCRRACRPKRRRRRRRCLRRRASRSRRRRRRSRRQRRDGCARRRRRGRRGSPPGRSGHDRRRRVSAGGRSRRRCRAPRASASRRPPRRGRRRCRRRAATACTLSIALTGSSSSVSRVPGDAPRTSTPATAPSRAITTVQPVGRRASVKWPTSRPATAVRPKDSRRSPVRRIVS